jgi:hypothetical protein
MLSIVFYNLLGKKRNPERILANPSQDNKNIQFASTTAAKMHCKFQAEILP